MAFAPSLENQFQVIERLPSGKILECYRVKERKLLGKERILRLLPTDLSKKSNLVEEFHRFFTRFSEISNQKHIPKVYSVAGDTGGAVYVLEEYFQGIPLPQYAESIRDSQSFRKDMVKVLAKVCEALHHAHQKEIFHLCIRPEDIRISHKNPNDVKLFGFGMQVFTRGNLDSLPARSRAYVAPEVLEGRPFKASSDICSLAVVIGECLPTVVTDRAILDTARSKNPDNRFPTARDFEAKLSEVSETKQGIARWLFSSRKKKTEPGPEILLTIFTLPPRVDIKANGKLLGTTSASGLTLPWEPDLKLVLERAGYHSETLTFPTAPAQERITIKLESLSSAPRPVTPIELRQEKLRTPVSSGERPKSEIPIELHRKQGRTSSLSLKWVARLIAIPLVAGFIAGSVMYFMYGRQHKPPAVSTSGTKPALLPPKPSSVAKHSIPIPSTIKNPRSRSLVLSGSVKMSDVIDMVDLVLRFTNEERSQRGLAPFQSSAALAFIAQVHSENMCEKRIMERDSDSFPDGWKKLRDRLDLYNLKTGSENIASVTIQEPEKWARQLVSSWMNNTLDRDNVLDPKWRYLGIGVCPCSGNVAYSALVFSDQEGVFR
jgi:serine/threonine protein kinase